VVWEDLIVGMISGSAIVASTYLLIRYTRRIANRLEQQAEKRKSLEKERSLLLDEVSLLKGILADRENEVARLKNQLKERGEKIEARLLPLSRKLAEIEGFIAQLDVTQKEERKATEKKTEPKKGE